jgi:nucleotidyltransferase AbiEii toxin of type IV toxin-antitoxin system
VHPNEIFQPTLTKLVAVLTRFGIRFHLTGGVTAVAYGEPRMTQDLDLVVDYDAASRHLESFLSALIEAGFHLELTTARRALASKAMFQVLDVEQALKLDLYPEFSIPGELDRSVMVEVLPGVTLPIAARSDAALSKLIWAAKGSHKSRRDLRQILRNASPEESATVRRTATSMGLVHDLDRILSEPEELA